MRIRSQGIRKLACTLCALCWLSLFTFLFTAESFDTFRRELTRLVGRVVGR